MDRGELIAFGAKCELARRSFWHFCRLLAPDFYRLDRLYLKALCDTLQAFLNADEKVLVINLPPRFGKSRTAQLFCQWVLGHDKTQKIIAISYNETLSTQFAKNVRNGIMTAKAEPLFPVFSDVFPRVAISKNDAAMNLWSIEGGYNNFLASSPTGTLTGFGATVLVYDDILKSAYEAYNEKIKDDHWTFFTDTALSRLEKGGRIIVIQTRWATNDFAGRLIRHCREIGEDIRQITMKARDDNGVYLCPDIIDAVKFAFLQKTIGEDIFSANYQQEPIDVKGALYGEFAVYDDPPPSKDIRCYIDTADTGADYLCAIAYIVHNRCAYVLDVLYTKAPMEITEPQTARLLSDNGVIRCDVESNSGGRSFARNVQTILNRDYPDHRCRVSWFHQSANKAARILSNSAAATRQVFFPRLWQSRWAEFHLAIARYQREGKNLHDDAPDALTGVVEAISNRLKLSINPAILRRRGIA